MRKMRAQFGRARHWFLQAFEQFCINYKTVSFLIHQLVIYQRNTKIIVNDAPKETKYARKLVIHIVHNRFLRTWFWGSFNNNQLEDKKEEVLYLIQNCWKAFKNQGSARLTYGRFSLLSNIHLLG